MAQAQKFKQVMSVIEKRIRSGDYLLHPIPSERKIADDTGVSYMTARKAVLALLDRKVLIRHPNGALDVYPGFAAEAGPAQILLLYPAYASAYLTQLRQTVTDTAQQYGISSRPVQYVHWDDPIVISAVANPRGTIVIPSSFDVPKHILAALCANRGVSLDLDLSDRGVPSIQLFPDAHIIKVFDHLRRLGHTRIDCISTHVHNPEIERRIRLWREWSARHGITGQLIEHAAPSFTDPMPFAYQAMQRLLKQGPLQATAIVGTTFPAAVGAMRACWDHGLTVGKDVSICAVNIESPARFMTPSVTGLETPDLTKLLGYCFDWFASDRAWTDNKCLQPEKAEIFKGESTGPASSKA